MRVNLLIALSFLSVECIFGAEAFFEEIPFAADSVSATPFGVKIRAAAVDSADTSYKFSVWVYDQGTSRYISQIWTPEGWKSGWTFYQPFYSNTGWQRINWAYLRVYKQHTPDSFYISFKFRDGDTDQTKTTWFEILNMSSEGGWLAGTVYKDPTFTVPYPNVNVIARNSGGRALGSYVTEDNRIDEGNPSIPGRFYTAVPVGSVDKIEFQDSVGNLVDGYIGSLPPWEITAGETTWVDPFCIENIEFTPDYPEPSDSVIIRVLLCNPGTAINNCSLLASHNSTEIGKLLLENIPAHSCTAPEIIWRNLPRGKFRILIQVTSGEFSTTASKFLQIGSGDVLINEIMYHPSTSGEWIEIINHSTNPISLKDWTIEDTQTKNAITIEDKWLAPEGFAVIAESTSLALQSIYGNFPAEIFSLGSKFPSLKDDGDTVILRDEDGIIQDILKYEDCWASNSKNTKGISLERISLNINTNDLKNWGSCVIASGGTPGKVNSIYADYIPKSVKLSVNPKSFSPKSEVAFISYTLPFAQARVKLYLYDRCGRCVRKLVDGSPSGAQSRWFWEEGEITWSHIWDGKNDDGEVLPMGIYIVYLEAKDQQSDGLISQKTTVVIGK